MRTAGVSLSKIRLTRRANVSSNVQIFDIRSSTDSSGLGHPNADFLAHVQILGKRNYNHPKRVALCDKHRGSKSSIWIVTITTLRHRSRTIDVKIPITIISSNLQASKQFVINAQLKESISFVCAASIHSESTTQM
ncbi:hypothetical protein T265_09959 [Opisthorchis viverrini]|uniref:Uncharacterized protein n=1 Tax=Opisthorchis viverrini TaxID=6198 RepID=A0A074Z8B3_OPIVI|nr:hypothetical protein T265_09959 [Opisthorchis viverrini]KER21802.1 hypothetical protein T265_09959 [Opisthorchis viverrini]